MTRSSQDNSAEYIILSLSGMKPSVTTNLLLLVQLRKLFLGLHRNSFIAALEPRGLARVAGGLALLNTLLHRIQFTLFALNLVGL